MEPKFKIIKKSWLWISLGAVLIVISRLLFIFNVKYSEEFTSGISLGIVGDISSDGYKNNIAQFLIDNNYENTNVNVDFDGENTTIKIQTSMSSDEEVSLLSENLKDYLISQNIIENTESIVQQTITGPSVGTYMKKTTIVALVVGLIFIFIYLLFAFSSVRNYISPASLGLVVFVTTLFDISLPAGAYGFWMMLNDTVQVDTIFVIALLTIMGYCINDTIVIFDRIRENINNISGSSDKIVYGEIFEKSIWQTMKRSLATSISTLLVVIAMFIFGTGIIQTFSFVIGTGIIFGTCGSIFLASSIAYLMTGRFKKEKNKL